MPKTNINNLYFKVGVRDDRRVAIFRGTPGTYTEILNIEYESPTRCRHCQSPQCLRLYCADSFSDSSGQRGDLMACLCAQTSDFFLVYVPKGHLNRPQHDFAGHCPGCGTMANSKKMPIVYDHTTSVDTRLNQERIFLCTHCRVFCRVINSKTGHGASDARMFAYCVSAPESFQPVAMSKQRECLQEYLIAASSHLNFTPPTPELVASDTTFEREEIFKIMNRLRDRYIRDIKPKPGQLDIMMNLSTIQEFVDRFNMRGVQSVYEREPAYAEMTIFEKSAFVLKDLAAFYFVVYLQKRITYEELSKFYGTLLSALQWCKLDDPSYDVRKNIDIAASIEQFRIAGGTFGTKEEETELT